MPQKKKPQSYSFDNSPEALQREIIEKLFSMQAKFPEVAILNDYYLALAYVVRDRMLHRYIQSAHTYFEKESRTVLYLSAEYLMGPQLGKNLISLGIYDEAAQAVKNLGLNLESLMEQEEEPGLGNGGLGRLAACYMDSLATLKIPAIGYGIRYEFGIFDQAIKDGWQVELTDKWLRYGNPWETPHPEIRFEVNFGGHTESFTDENGRYRTRWIPEQLVLGVPYDTPVLGYGVKNANFLRLWCAHACESFDFQAFNVGNYYKAVEQKMISENITKVLYPNDEAAAGRRLRLQQQYFFVSCSLQDMIRLFRQREIDLSQLPDKFVAQLNDTHPALAVAELMRLLVDEYLMDWEPAWAITTRIFAYTNHTLLPEALETWPAPLMHQLLPRLLEIIFEINRRFLDNVVRPRTHNGETISRLSLIAETGEKSIRMANLACVGSQAINGVAELHTDLLKKTVLKDFHDLWPEKFTNITNGVTPRRFMVLSNPGQTRLLCETIGDQWIRDLNCLTGLEPFADDSQFREQWAVVQAAAKRRLAGMILKTTGISVNPDSMFDVQVKRIHEYKRQHLNVLHVLTRYRRIKQGLAKNIPARTFIFGGKAAPGYAMAKLIIRLIHAAADLINNDPDVAELMKVVFYPDFNVKNAQPVYPAADLSEQISTAGKEASGTGNMKFSLNGALTIGTLDGANVEIREAVGPKNFFLFGLTADQVEKSWAEGYIPMERYTTHAELRGVIDMIAGGELFPQEPALFKPLVDSLLYRDAFMVLADYEDYVKCQDTVDQKFLNQQDWLRMSILNVARMGKFSSDRSIAEYNQKIWHVQPVDVTI